jgi:hypothetical protein
MLAPGNEKNYQTAQSDNDAPEIQLPGLGILIRG